MRIKKKLEENIYPASKSKIKNNWIPETRTFTIKKKTTDFFFFF